MIHGAMDASGLSLANLVGEKLFVKIPAWKPDQVTAVTLVAVDIGGIWIESPDFMEEFFAGTPCPISQDSIQLFLPYSQILAVFHLGGGAWISDKTIE
jgi:hypothetical protein